MCPKQNNGDFGEKAASRYDDKWASLSAMKDALHLFAKVALSDLPRDSHVLCVGVGTGAELFSLARTFPQWSFTAVDPAPAMLQICKDKATELGIYERCRFHDGFVETLPRDFKFDGATCFLVSQFLTNHDDRSAFFSEIAARLVGRGILVSADISGDPGDPRFKTLVDMWAQMMRYAKIPGEEVETMIDSLGSTVAVIPPSKVEDLLLGSGFEETTLIFQTLLVHAWVSMTK